MDDQTRDPNPLVGIGGPAGRREMPADPRKTDLEMFYEILPHIVGGYAGKSVDARSANASALIMAREMLGQCALLGVCRLTVQCLDGLPLALMPAGQHQANPSVAQPQQQPTAGVAYGQGGLVSQQPNPPPAQHHGQQPNFGDGSRGVLVGQFPNGTQPPPY